VATPAKDNSGEKSPPLMNSTQCSKIFPWSARIQHIVPAIASTTTRKKTSKIGNSTAIIEEGIARFARSS
jgi:hypothetical protein